ncbi:hypothetical protein TCAL_16851 [Tigriopus californicus]|uniref:Uncharacterized protein n=1 Tax=Tigriopus californicus TaxID=6832 RepID=A0A553PBR3_TIGCA|nr:hypothetical protein TCAL_16851 [Tigriopus californicus]
MAAEKNKSRAEAIGPRCVAPGQESGVEVFLHGNDEITSVVHVFEYVNGAYASRRLLKSLKFLPESWPDQEVVQAVCRREQTKETECKLRNEFSDVFDEKNLKPMKGSPMTITLEDNAIPHQERNARNIPVAYEGQVKKQLDDMLDDVIIEWVVEPSAWCHPIVVVNKKGTSEMRMTVDLKKLNSQGGAPVTLFSYNWFPTWKTFSVASEVFHLDFIFLGIFCLVLLISSRSALPMDQSHDPVDHGTFPPVEC